MRALPAYTFAPSITASMPWPASSVTEEMRPASTGWPYAANIDCAMGCDELDSASAASVSSSSSLTPTGCAFVTRNAPLVSVPVLSNTQVFTCASASMQLEPLSRMPSRDAPPSPPKNDSGTDTTSAHGQDTTRKFSARITQSVRF